MIPGSDYTITAFQALYPDIPEVEISAAYECFRRYARLGFEIATARQVLTTATERGSVEAGAVDPSTFTKTG